MALSKNENKVKFGLKRVAFALAAIAEDGSATYETPVTFPGARTLSMEPQGAGEPWYADDGVYYYNSAPASRQGDLEMARIIDTFKKQVLGYIADANGILLEDMNPAEVHFALLFETMNDKHPRRYVMYNCMATAPAVGSATNEGSKEPQTETSAIMSSGIYVPSHGKWFDHGETTPKTDPEAYANWFNAVQIPGPPPDPYPIKTVSGNPVIITDGADGVPVTALTVDIESQTGVTGARITRTGKNLCRLYSYQYTGDSMDVVYTNDSVTINGTPGSNFSVPTSDNVPQDGFFTLPAGTYKPSVTASDVGVEIVSYNPTAVISSGEAFTLAAETTVFARLHLRAGVTYDNLVVHIQVERGTSATEYEPYTGDIYAITFPAEAGAITSGTLDVVNGVLTTGGQDYDVTPIDVTTLLGNNTIWADTGAVTVSYHSDPRFDD